MEESDQNPENKEKKGSTLDKIVLGAIIGTAVGSVVGMSIAPKKGTENRKVVAEASKKTGSTLKKLIKRILYGDS